MRRLLQLVLFVCANLLVTLSLAQTDATQVAPPKGLNTTDAIVVDKATVGGIKIAVVPFAWQSAGLPPIAEQDIAKVVRSDFNRVGQFVALPENAYPDLPSTLAEVNFDTWKVAQQQYIVVGRVLDNDDNTFRIEFQLARVASGETLLSLAIQGRPGDLRSVGHQIADLIYEKIMNVRGAFWTRIAYITSQGTGRNIKYQLRVADSDGFNPQNVVQSPEPLLSISWSPDGKQLAYVSFERGNSAIYLQDIGTGQRRLISSFRGINGAPAFSPDGSKLALTLSRSGSPEINLYDLQSNQFTQITRHFSIDTEPVWMPSGNELLFTSDRSGKPQIYKIGTAGGDPVRVSFNGEYNARASVSYDGRKIAMVQGNNNVYRIAVLDRSRGEPGVTRVITDGRLDETPSFAPNASMVLYASREGTRGVLYAVAADGSVRQKLAFSEGDVREPAWGPFRQR